MTSSLAFNDVAQALADGRSTVHPAEAHGCLCGALCVHRGYTIGDWLDEILPDAAATTSREGTLAELFEQSAACLAAPDMEFDPLLPDDDTALEERAEALGAWCQGFLYGYGTAGTGERPKLSGDVAEVLADLAEISRGGAVGLDPAEVEEEAYVELVEFLRVGVQTVYDAGFARPAPPAPRRRH